MEDRNSKNNLRAGPGSSGAGESRAPPQGGARSVYMEGPTTARKDEEAAKAARQRAILAALSGDGGKKSDSPKPAPISAPAAELLTDEDVDFSQLQPNGRERMLKLMQKKKLRGDKDLPRALLTRDVKMPPPSTGKVPIGRVSQHGCDLPGHDSEDWLSESSEMSGISLDPESLPTFSDLTRRKRRSDDDMAPPLSKGAVPKAKRGRGRPPTTGQYVGLAKAQADLDHEKEEALRLQAEEEIAEAARVARETRSSLLASPAAMEEDRPEQTNYALAQCVDTSLGTISMVAAKSKNLKGTFLGLLKEAVDDIRATVSEMRNRGATEEVKAFEAQNARLQNQVESLRKKLEELRRQVMNPAEQDMRQLLSEVSRSTIETFSNMLNARLAGLESRLLPEPRLRPPLAADRARSITPAPVESVEAPQDVTPGPPRQKAKGKPATKKTRQPVAAAAPQEASSPIRAYSIRWMGGSGMARRTAARARVLRLLLRDTMRALQDLCPAAPPNAPDVSGAVAELSRLAARPAALVVLGSTASARARLVNCLLGARLLPIDLPRGCRWIRIQFGSSTQAHLTLGNSEFELVDELECNRRPWDTLPLQDVLRQDPSDISTMLEVELNNSFLKTGHRIIIPPDIATDPGPSTYSTLKQLHADLFAKREAILKNFNPVYLYALDSFGSNIFNENLSLAKYTPSRSEEEFWNTFNLHYMARMGAGEEMRLDKAEEMFEETLMGVDDNAVFTPENCLDLHQIKELDPNSQVYFILFADSVSGPNGRPDVAPDVTESAGSGESTYNADDLPESDQDFADGALRNTESQEHIPRVALEERQVSFMNDLLDQWELLTSPPPKHHVGSTWSIVDEQAFNTELDESRYGERVVRTRSGLIRAVQRYVADVAHTQLLVQCTKLSEIHVKLLQQFLLSSFELARELQVVPRNIHYAAHMERQLYEMITEKFSMGEKRRELLRLVEEVLRDLRPHLEQVDWSVDDLPCHQDKRFTVSTSIFYSSRSSIDVRPDPDRLDRTGPDRSDSEAEEAASCYEFDDYEIIDSADEGLCVSESMGYMLNSEAGTSMLSVCSGTNLSSKQASLDVQRAVLSKLSRMISLKLVNFVDCLKETYFGTLQRCIENLECVSSSAGGRAASGAVRQLLAAVRAVDLEPAADASLLPRLWDALRRLVYRLCVPYEEEGVCCVLSPQWRRRTALATLDSLTPARLTRLISTQILERLSAAHERYQAALSALAAALTARLDHTMDAKYNIRRKVAPRFARLCLESTSMCDLLKYGNPELGREIGRGQYGVVYAVRGSWGGHAPAAVKSVRPPDDRAYRDLAMEFFYTRSIPAHPRIVQLLGSVVQRGGGGGGAGVLLVSRRYSRDLHAAVAAGLPLPARMSVAADIVEGIRYLHSLGLIHRDIKLKNVLLDTNNRAALADLGFCALGPLLGGSVVGTPVHMAPELLGGEYDTAVDVYAFAVLFWYLCAGTVRLPAAFETFQNKQQLWTKVKRGLRPERLPHFTDEMWDIMTSCWAPDPTARALLGDVQPRIERILEWARDLPPESVVARDEWSGASDSDIC